MAEMGARAGGFRVLSRDRDAKYSAVVDALFQAEAVDIVPMPAEAPRANAVAERWVRTVRGECLDWVLIYNTRHLLAVVGEYLAHYNGNRPYQGRGQRPPDHDALPAPVTDLSAVRVRRTKLVHGLI